jgi:Domain of unknown function (DUF4296)
MKKLKLPPSVIAVFFTLFACKNDKIQLPVPQEKMVDVLVDIHIAEAYIENVNTTLKDSMTRIYYPQIFKHHGITAKLYDSTFAVLSNQPDLMKSVYDDVMERVENRQKIMKGDTLNTITPKN